MTYRAILVAGPTASGKSAKAIEYADQCGKSAVIINADALQVYNCWNILSARPSERVCQMVPHKLYGYVSPHMYYSVAQWLTDIETILCNTSLMPIIVGGTGLYFQALTKGFTVIPATPDSVRQKAQFVFNNAGISALLDEIDEETKAWLDCTNPARVMRAWEVQKSTNRSFTSWRADTPPALLPLDQVKTHIIMPPREMLYDRCDKRVHEMIENGAVQEVENVMYKNLPVHMPALKAIGYKELSSYIHGKCTLEAAVDLMQQATRNYAKRQMTWIRSKMSEW